MADEPLLRTACHEWHAAHGGRIVDFAGWEMPVQYSTITEEHLAVRHAAGLFDIAHMGRLTFKGPDASRFLDSIVTNDVASLKLGQIRYALITNEAGGILDDVLVYRFESSYLLVVNASNRLKIVKWIEDHIDGFDVEFEDITVSRFMLALQGPKALEVLDPLVDTDLTDISYYYGTESSIADQAAIVSRTGYTGEDGFEVIVAADFGLSLWKTLIEQGATVGLKPAGLGCRDTLRLEAAMPLYGHELDESIDPLTAGLGFAVKLDSADFIGKSALVAAKQTGTTKKRIGLVLEGRRIAREGATVLNEGEAVGEVTSGTFSPTLEKPIAMAYVQPGCSAVGTKLTVDIRGKSISADVIKLPFYRRG